MKLNDGEAKDLGPEMPNLGTGKEDDMRKDTDKGDPEKKATLVNGQPLTNGPIPSSQPFEDQDSVQQSIPASKSKEKVMNGESGGMISPESLEAT